MGQVQKLMAALKKRSSIVGAVAAAATLVAAVLVVQSSPRSELDVQLSDGAVWLASTAVGGVSLLDGGSGTIAASLGVADPGDEFTVEQFGSDAVIVNQTAGTVARLDGASWEIPTGRIQFGVPGQPLSVVAGADNGWLMTPGQATTLELEELALRTPIPVAAPFADGIVTDDGALLYASTDPDLPVQRFEAVGGQSSNVADLDGPTALMDLGPLVAAVDLDDGSVWLDGVGIVCDQLEFPDGAELNASGGEGLLIVVSDQGGAFVWDPTETGCPGANDFINLGPGDYGEPALTDGWAVIPEIATSSVLIIDLEDLSLTNRQALEGVQAGTEVTLIAEDGSIWYNDPASAQAGLIRRDGTVVPIAKYEEGATGFTSAPVNDAPDDAENMSLAGAAQQEQADDVAPEAEQVAGPELTTSTLADGGDVEPETVTTSTTVPSGPDTTTSGSPDTTDPTTDTTDPGTSETTSGITDTTDGVTDTTDPGSTTSTTEPPEEEEFAISLGVSAFSVVEGNTINFTAITQHGNPNSWSIDFSPAGPQTLPIEQFGSFRILFPEAGRFVATMEACQSPTDCTQAQAVITIVPDADAIPLVAAVDGPATVVVGETATFRDISQGEPDSWSWATDGGSPATATSETVDVAWPTPGPRTVTLQVGRGSSTRTTTFDIVVVNAPTPAAFGITCSPVLVEVGNSVTCQLDGDASDFSGLAFSTSADGSAGFTSSILSPGRFTMRSTQPRSITVTLTGTDDGTGDQRSDNASIDYFEALCTQALPQVTVAGPTTLEIGQTGSYTGSTNGSCGDVSRNWTASGGGSVSNPNAATTNISWNTPGTYTVTFDYADGSGPGTGTRTVTVNDPGPVVVAPSISISGSSSLDTDETGSFNFSNSGGPIDSRSWTTNGGGGSGSAEAFSTSWSSPGNYTVTLNVSGPGGSDTATFAVAVTDPPVPASPFGMTCDRASAEVNQIFSCDLTTGDPANFSNPTWSVSPASAQSWLMNEWSYDAAGTVAGSTVTVTLSAVDLGTGQTVSASDSVSITAPVVNPQPLSIGCDQGTAEMLEIVSCFLNSGNESAFNSPSWSVSGDHDRWGGSAFALDVAGNSVGTITVTLSAVDVGTGQTVSASASITITAIAPPPPPTMSVSCSMLNDIRARCSASNTDGYSSPSWAVSGDGLLRWGGGGVFTIEVGTTVAGSTITVTVTATHSSGQVGSASGSITIANAT